MPLTRAPLRVTMRRVGNRRETASRCAKRSSIGFVMGTPETSGNESPLRRHKNVAQSPSSLTGVGSNEILKALPAK